MTRFAARATRSLALAGLTLRSLALSSACGLLASSSACGSVAGTGAESLDAGNADAAPFADAAGGGGRTQVCPSSKPSSGDACTGVLACEYGDDPFLSCDTVIACTGGVWSTTQAPAATGCSTTNPPGCPTSLGEASGGGCKPNLACYYPQARCTCGTLVPGAPAEWLCDTPTNTTVDASTGASCPTPRPRVGTACAEAGLTCDYGRCQEEDDVLSCTSGTWVQTPASTSGCPL